MRGYPSRTTLSHNDKGGAHDSKNSKLMAKSGRKDLQINLIFAVLSTLLFISFVVKNMGLLLAYGNPRVVANLGKEKCWSASNVANGKRITFSNIERSQRSGRNVFIIENCEKENGLLVLLHGCSRLASSFFYSPEGVLIVEKALQHGLSILAVTKADERGCWNLEAERLPLIDLITKVRSELKMDAYPLYGFGASSGGAMITELTTSPLPFCAVNVQISPLKADISAPAAVYTFMKDDLTMQKFSRHILPYVQKTKPNLKLQVITIDKPPVTEDYFSKKIKGIDGQLSQRIFKTLKTKGVLKQIPQTVTNPSSKHAPVFNYILDANPRSEKDLLLEYEVSDATDGSESKIAAGPFYIDPSVSAMLTKEEKLDFSTLPLNEELNVLYNYHEIVATKFDEVLQFFTENNNDKKACNAMLVRPRPS